MKTLSFIKINFWYVLSWSNITKNVIGFLSNPSMDLSVYNIAYIIFNFVKMWVIVKLLDIVKLLKSYVNTNLSIIQLAFFACYRNSVSNTTIHTSIPLTYEIQIMHAFC